MRKVNQYYCQNCLNKQHPAHPFSPKCCYGHYEQSNFPLLPVKSTSSYIQAQLQNAAHTLIANNRAILFDMVLSQSNDDITYDNTIGKFMLAPNCTYFVSWWIAIDGTDISNNLDFAVAINDIPFAIGSAPEVTCQLSGTALIPTKAVPVRLSIMNASGNTIRFAATSVQANIIVIKLS